LKTKIHNYKNIIIFISVFFIYALVSFAFFGLKLYPNFSSQYVGMSSDPCGSIWGLYWWDYVLVHHIPALFSPYLFAPFGLNLTQSLPIILPWTLMLPFTHYFGPVASYNLLVLFSGITAAYAAYLLCWYMTRSHVPSIIGGYLFGYSSYQICQTLAHICLVINAFLPLMILVILLYYHKVIRPVVFVVLFGFLLTCQFYTNAETYVFFFFFLGLFILMLGVVYWEYRLVLIRFVGLLALAYMLALCFESCYLYYFFCGQGASFIKPYLGNDFLHFFIPNSIAWLGGNLLEPINTHFKQGILEASAYLGIPLIIILFLFAKEFWSQKIWKILILFVILISILTMGNVLHFRGHVYLKWMPWQWFTHVPIIRYANPVRLTLFSSLVISVIVAYWLRYSVRNIYFKYCLAGLAILFLLPNPKPYDGQWVTPIKVSPFFQRGAYKKFIKPNDIVLFLPLTWDSVADGMFWQTQSHLYFRLAIASTGASPSGFLKFEPLLNTAAGNPQKVTIKEYKNFFNTLQISAIFIPNSQYEQWQFLLNQINAKPFKTDEFMIVHKPMQGW